MQFVPPEAVGDVLTTAVGVVAPFDKAARQRRHEARFCEVLNLKLQHEAMVRACREELLRIQGAIAELNEIPDQPA